MFSLFFFKVIGLVGVVCTLDCNAKYTYQNMKSVGGASASIVELGYWSHRAQRVHQNCTRWTTHNGLSSDLQSSSLVNLHFILRWKRNIVLLPNKLTEPYVIYGRYIKFIVLQK